MNLPLIDKAPAKINLTLHVTGRRADGYHTLESLVAFADLADELSLDAGSTEALQVSGPFAAVSGRPEDNLVLKAAAALRLTMAALRSGQFRLSKNIPVAAGLGGGSADAAAALRLLARINGLDLQDPRVLAAAQDTGADVPVCLVPRATMMRGIGEILSPLPEFPALSAVLVNPGVPLSTRDVFHVYAGSTGPRPIGDVPHDRAAMLRWLADDSNDLTPAAIACAPAIGEVLDRLVQLPGCRLARMSGSGATCFALFDDDGAARAAARALQSSCGHWWSCPVTLR